MLKGLLRDFLKNSSLKFSWGVSPFFSSGSFSEKSSSYRNLPETSSVIPFQVSSKLEISSEFPSGMFSEIPVWLKFLQKHLKRIFENSRELCIHFSKCLKTEFFSKFLNISWKNLAKILSEILPRVFLTNHWEMSTRKDFSRDYLRSCLRSSFMDFFRNFNRNYTKKKYWMNY